MPIEHPDDFIEAYRLRAKLKDLHELTGRESKEATDFVVNGINAAIQAGANDVVVDVGCGDGALLKSLSGKISRGIGIASSEEEIEKLKHAYPHENSLEFLLSVASKIELANEIADRVVCNSVFHFLPTTQHMRDSLKEFARIAKPSALVFVGEVPCIDEQSSLKTRQTGLIGFLGRVKYHFQSNGGGASRLDLIKRVFRYVRARVSRDTIFIIAPKKTIYMESNEFVAFAKSVGLDLIWQCFHPELGPMGTKRTSTSRVDYLFSKRKNG